MLTVSSYFCNVSEVRTCKDDDDVDDDDDDDDRYWFTVALQTSMLDHGSLRRQLKEKLRRMSAS